MGHVYTCLLDDVFVMDTIELDHVGVMMINTIHEQREQVMSMRLWPLKKT